MSALASPTLRNAVWPHQTRRHYEVIDNGDGALALKPNRSIITAAIIHVVEYDDIVIAAGSALPELLL